MNLDRMSDQKLKTQILILVSKEKALTIQVLKHLREIEDRRLFADDGYSSMFSYCTEHLGYSRYEAHGRIQAMRLMKSSKKIEKAIDQEKLSLSNAAQAQTFIRQEEKEQERKFTALEKENVVQDILEKSNRDAQKTLDCKKTTPKAETLKITLGARTIKRLKEFKALAGDYSDEEIIDLLLADKLKEKKTRNTKPITISNTRYIPQKVKDAVTKRSDNQCEFQAKSGKRCDEKRNLEYDHIRPFSLGGRSDIQNIRYLCKTHNLRAAIETFGREKMRPYLN